MAKVDFMTMRSAKQPAKFSGGELDVHGLPAEKMAQLFEEFPEAYELINGGNVTLSQLVKATPGFVASVISSGAGHDDPEGRSVAAGLSGADQFDLCSAILKLSIPESVTGFLGKLGQAIQPVPEQKAKPVKVDLELDLEADIRPATKVKA